jgi:hypothetical protein
MAAVESDLPPSIPHPIADATDTLHASNAVESIHELDSSDNQPLATDANDTSSQEVTKPAFDNSAVCILLCPLCCKLILWSLLLSMPHSGLWSRRILVKMRLMKPLRILQMLKSRLRLTPVLTTSRLVTSPNPLLPWIRMYVTLDFECMPR